MVRIPALQGNPGPIQDTQERLREEACAHSLKKFCLQLRRLLRCFFVVMELLQSPLEAYLFRAHRWYLQTNSSSQLLVFLAGSSF